MREALGEWFTDERLEPHLVLAGVVLLVALVAGALVALGL